MERDQNGIHVRTRGAGEGASSRHNDLLRIRQSPSRTPLPWKGLPAIVVVLHRFTPGHGCAEPGQGAPSVRCRDEQLPDRSARSPGQRVHRRRRGALHWRLHAAVGGRGPARQVEPLDDLLDQPAGRLDGDPDRCPRDVVRLPQDAQPLLILQFATVAPGTCSALGGPARSGQEFPDDLRTCCCSMGAGVPPATSPAR